MIFQVMLISKRKGPFCAVALQREAPVWEGADRGWQVDLRNPESKPQVAEGKSHEQAVFGNLGLSSA